MHPFVTEPLAIPDAFRDRLIDGSKARLDVNDLLFAVDLLITDYSSIVFEYSTLGRPMLFYAYDLDEYIGSRDFYVPFEAFVPGRIVRTIPELVDAIRRDDYEVEKVPRFAGRTSPTSTPVRRIGSSTSWSWPGERVPGLHRVDRLGAAAVRRPASRWRGRGCGRDDASPATFALVRADRSSVVMRPTGSHRDVDSGALVLRFNIVVGPGVWPLDPGRWSLVQRDDAESEDQPVAAPDASQLTAAARGVAIPRGTYRATPVASHRPAAWHSISHSRRRVPHLGPVARVAGALRAASWTAVFGVMKLVAGVSGHRVLFVTGNQNGPQGN